MLRGLVFAAAMIVVRLFQGTLINAFQTQAALISIVLLILFIAAVVVWGVLDGREDARSQPDPDRRGDLAMTWLVAGVVAGLVSGFVTWLISTFYTLYVGGLIQELTTFAAFVALLVFLGGIGGATLGRYLIDRKGDYAPRAGGGDEDRVDTDVFAAVRSDEATAEGGAWADEQQSAVATAEREEGTTEEVPADRREETTESIPTQETEEGKGDTERTRRWTKRKEDQR